MANRSDEELNEESSEWREPYPAAIDTPPRASLPPPSAEPSDFEELCMKVIKAGDMTSVRNDKVRDEVRFEVAVAMVYARRNPHIIVEGCGNKALDGNSTVQALWRRVAEECHFSEEEKPAPLGSKLSKVATYARMILTEKWSEIQLPNFGAWRTKEFMTHIEALGNLIDGFNPNAYDLKLCEALRRLAEKMARREVQGFINCQDAGTTSVVMHAEAMDEARASEAPLACGGEAAAAKALARSTEPRSQAKRQCLGAVAECAGASEPSSSAGAPPNGAVAPPSSVGAPTPAWAARPPAPPTPPEPMQAESPAPPASLVPLVPAVPLLPPMHAVSLVPPVHVVSLMPAVRAARRTRTTVWWRRFPFARRIHR